MRQLITRLDDDLHDRLKQRAHDEGRSVNALVTELLERALPDLSPRERLRRRLRAQGRLAEVPTVENPPSREEVIALLRGDAGRAVLDALAQDRASR